MATFGLFDIFDKINRSNGNYCIVCFRTSKERRLVNPVSFKRFFTFVSGCTAYCENGKVCYICEGLASSAMKFHRAATLGVELDNLFHLIRTKGLRNIVLGHLNGVLSSSTKLCQRAAKSQEELQRVQRSLPHSLAFTDTLMLSVDRPPFTKPAVALEVNTTGEDTIILDDDIVCPTRRVRTAVNQHEMTFSVTNKKTNDIVLHPMVTGSDGSIYVPSLRLQILPNHLFKSVSEQHIEFHTNAKPAIAEQDNSTALADHRLERATAGNECVTSNRKNDWQRPQNMNCESVQSESVDSKKKKYSDSSNDVKVTSDGAKLVIAEKRPILTTDKVDWEDKIPMDVISFMDATDPNPEDRIMQPTSRPALGVISNVRSIEEDDPDLDGIECIDLC